MIELTAFVIAGFYEASARPDLQREQFLNRSQEHGENRDHNTVVRHGRRILRDPAEVDHESSDKTCDLGR